MKDQKAKSTKSTILPALFFLLIIVGVSSAHYCLSQKKLPTFIQVNNLPKWDLETKLGFFARVASYIGVLIFVSSSLVISGRVFHRKLFHIKKEPAKEADPIHIVILNQALRNNTEQCVVFLGNFGYWFLTKAKEDDLQMIYCFAFFFLLYRVLFTLGYMTGIVLKTTVLREVGFAGTLTINGLLLAKNFGFDLV